MDRAELQKEAIMAVHQNLPEEERETIDGIARDLRVAIKATQQPTGGQAGSTTVMEILGALGMFLERDAQQ